MPTTVTRTAFLSKPVAQSFAAITDLHAWALDYSRGDRERAALSMLISGVYAAILILVGRSLFEHTLELAIPAIAFLALVALGVWLWRRRPRDEAHPVHAA